MEKNERTEMHEAFSLFHENLIDVDLKIRKEIITNKLKIDKLILNALKPLEMVLKKSEVTNLSNQILNEMIKETEAGKNRNCTLLKKGVEMINNAPDVFGNKDKKIEQIKEITKIDNSFPKKAGRPHEFDAIKKISIILVDLAKKYSPVTLENPTKFKHGGTAFHEASEKLKIIGIQKSPKAIHDLYYCP